MSFRNWIILILLSLTTLYLEAQDSVRNDVVDKISEPSIVLTPPSISKKEKCAVLFVLPFTGGVSSKFMRVYFNDWNTNPNWQADYNLFLTKLAPTIPLILVMVSGNSSTKDHDTKGFTDAITRFDSQIKKDVALLEKQYSIDKTKLYLTGFSLGGDLSWAISQKNPGMFRGAVIAGSRCGYRTNNGFTIQKRSDYKVYLAGGQLESPEVMKGIEQAKADLTKANIEHIYFEIPSVGHKMIPEGKFLEGLRFILGLESFPTGTN